MGALPAQSSNNRDVPVSAYVPCFNNEATLAQTIASIRTQQTPLDELFIVDDGSSDGSVACAESLGCRVIRHASNLGRGATPLKAST